MSDSSHYHNLSNEDNHLYAKEQNSQSVYSDKEVLPEELSDDVGEGHAHKKDAPKASMIGSALNIANTIMGAGVLALPNVITQFGVLLGSGIIVLSCIFTWISCVLLLKAKNLSRHSKFRTIGKHCFGSTGLWAVKAIIIVNNFGLGIIYLIVFSNVASNLVTGFATDCVADGGFYCQHWFLVLVGAAIVTPFVFQNSMTKLAKASAVAVCASIIFSIVTIENYISNAAQGTSASGINILPVIKSPVSALSSITSVFLAFTFQFNFFPVYKCLQDPTDKRMKATTGMGMLLVLTIYLCVANAGYLTFGENTSNLLQNFTRDNLGLPKFIIVNCVLLISSTLTQPLMFFGAKNEIYGAIKLLRKHLAKRNNNGARPIQEQIETGDEEENEEDEKVIERKYGFKGVSYQVYVGILFALIVVMAIVVPQINTVFSFVGSTAANGLNFILPTAFYLKLCSRKGKLRKVSWVIMVIGFVAGITGITTSAINL